KGNAHRCGRGRLRCFADVDICATLQAGHLRCFADVDICATLQARRLRYLPLESDVRMTSIRPAGLAGMATLLVTLMLAGAAPPAAAADSDAPSEIKSRHNAVQYAIDRGNDLLDIVRLRVGVPHKA